MSVIVGSEGSGIEVGRKIEARRVGLYCGRGVKTNENDGLIWTTDRLPIWNMTGD